MSEFNKEVFLQNLKEVNTVLKQIHICIDNIVKLSNDMAGADSEINEAILQLQQNVITINGTLNGHTQDITNINTALSNKMYKVIEVSDSATSGTFTEEQYSQIINDKSVVIKYGSGLYYREFEYTLDNDFIRFRHLNTLSVSSNVITASSQYITVPKSINIWTYTSNSDIKFYNQNYIDTYIQAKLSSGVNIKTINNESLLGSGDISVGSEIHLYQHNVYVACANGIQYIHTFYLTTDTKFTTATLSNYIQVLKDKYTNSSDSNYVACNFEYIASTNKDYRILYLVSVNTSNNNVVFKVNYNNSSILNDTVIPQSIYYDNVVQIF